MVWTPRLSQDHHGIDGWPNIKQRSGRLIRTHAGKPCQYCGQLMTRNGKSCATRDHVFPKSLGWRINDLKGLNRAIVCASCNTSKKDRNIVEFWYRLQKGGDARAPIVFKYIERMWLNGVLPPMGGLKYYDAALAKLQNDSALTRQSQAGSTDSANP